MPAYADPLATLTIDHEGVVGTIDVGLYCADNVAMLTNLRVTYRGRKYTDLWTTYANETINWHRFMVAANPHNLHTDDTRLVDYADVVQKLEYIETARVSVPDWMGDNVRVYLDDTYMWETAIRNVDTFGIAGDNVRDRIRQAIATAWLEHDPGDGHLEAKVAEAQRVLDYALENLSKAQTKVDVAENTLFLARMALERRSNRG